MRRALLIITALCGLLAIVAAVVFVVRVRRGGPSTDAGGGTMPSAPGSSAPRAADTGTRPIQSGGITIDARRQQLIGVRTAPVTRGPLPHVLRTVGVVRYDETGLFDVNVRVDGWIRDLYADVTGQSIQKGQRLFTLYSPDLLATQQEYLLALKTRDELRASVIADARERADELVTSARERLRLWDLSEDDLASLDQTRRPLDVVGFRSPASGVVMEKVALKGMHVQPGQTLFKVASLSDVWIEADVYEPDMALAQVGQRATVTLDAFPGESLQGRAIYVYPFVDDSARTVKVRFQFANTQGRLKPGMFANVELQGREASGLTVPANAVLDSGTEQTVFLAEGNGYFTPRPVTVGRRAADRVEILDGLKEGEQVATSAAFFLDSESQLRAGLQNYAAPTSPAGAAVAAAPALQIALRTTPDPARTGENQFEVSVRGADGTPLVDATVAVQLFMPAMPTMNMPAMRNEVPLSASGPGVYRGTGQVMMAGRWEATVVVSRGGQTLGSRQQPLVAR